MICRHDVYEAGQYNFEQIIADVLLWCILVVYNVYVLKIRKT